MKSYYSERLGCEVISLNLISENPSQQEIKDRILSADIKESIKIF